MPDGHSIVDKAGHRRASVRIKLHEDGTGRTYRQHCLGSNEVPEVAIAEEDLATIDIYARDALPLFVGNNWLTGTPTLLAADVACTDYRVAEGGKLVALKSVAKMRVKRVLCSQSSQRSSLISRTHSGHSPS